MNVNVVIVLAVSAFSATGALKCDPPTATLGDSYTLTWSGYVTTNTVTWRSNSLNILANCFVDTEHCSTGSTVFDRQISRNPDGTITTYLTLYIVIEGYDKNNFTLVAYPDIHDVCTDLEVFSRPEVELSNCPSGQYISEGYIKPGTSVSCKCILTKRGYPPAVAQWYNVSGDNNFEAVGTHGEDGSASLTVSAGPSESFLNFTCFARSGQRPLDFPSESSSFSLQAAFPPKILRFYREPQYPIYDTLVRFSCDVSSGPPADVVVYKKGSNVTLASKNLKARCDDMGEFVCRATNTFLNSSTEKSVTLYVYCSLQILNDKKDSYKFTSKLGSNFVTSFDVVGYPAPTSFALAEQESGSDNPVIISSNSQSYQMSSKYKFGYTLTNLPYGRVYVTINNVSESDLNSYTLFVDNGYGNGLMYNFSIVKDNHKNGPTSTADIDLLPAIISGALAGLVIVGLVILLIVKRKSLRRMFSKTRCIVFCKKKKNVYEGSTNNEGREISNTYMNMAVNTDTTLKIRQRQDYDEIDVVAQENDNSQYEQFSVAPKRHYQNVTIGSSI